MKHDAKRQTDEETKKLALTVIILLLFVFVLYGMAPFT